MRVNRSLMLDDSVDFIQERAAPALVFIYQLTALLCFAIIPLLAANWLRQPFIGAFLEHTLMINTVTPTRPGTWDLQGQGLPFGYQLAGIDDHPIGDSRQFSQVISTYQAGQQVSLTLRRRLDGPPETITRVVTLRQFPTADRLTYLIIPYITGLFYLVSSVWVFSLRRWDAAGRAFALFHRRPGCGGGLPV